MLQVPPLAHNVEEVSALAQYFTLVAASRSHNSTQKRNRESNDQVSETQSATEKKIVAIKETSKAESLSPEVAKELSKNSAVSNDPSKGQNINLLF